MGLYLNTDTGEQIPLATNTGWSDVGAWIESLEGADAASHLWEHGWTEPASVLQDELQSHLDASPPKQADAAKTVQELIASLTRIPDDSAVVVTDGMDAEEDGDAPPG